MIELERFIYEDLVGISEKPSRRDLYDLQLPRLKKTLECAIANSTFYRELFRREGIIPEELTEIGDISTLPFTDPSDLRGHSYEFLCVSQSEIERVFALETAGTTGPPKRVFFSRDDLNKIKSYMGAAMKSVARWVGLKEDFRVQIFLPDGRPSSQAKLLSEGIERVGGEAIATDLSLCNEDHIQKMKETRPDILFGSVPYIYRMTQESTEKDLREINPRALFLTSEYLPKPMRRRLEELWDSEVYYHYGMTEMGFGGGIECREHDGFHFNEGDLLFETVDPETGEKVKEGEEGELVFTTLNREAMPLIRYKTGDLARLHLGCGCGVLTLMKIGNSIKRKEGALSVRGRSLHYNMLADIIYAIPEIVDFEASLWDKNFLEIKVEATEMERRIKREVAEAVQGLIKELRIEVELAKPGSLRRGGRTKRSIIDKRVVGGSSPSPPSSYL